METLTSLVRRISVYMPLPVSAWKHLPAVAAGAGGSADLGNGGFARIRATFIGKKAA
jgi:hypothetical protein